MIVRLAPSSRPLPLLFVALLFLRLAPSSRPLSLLFVVVLFLFVFPRPSPPSVINVVIILHVFPWPSPPWVINVLIIIWKANLGNSPNGPIGVEIVEEKIGTQPASRGAPVPKLCLSVATTKQRTTRNRLRIYARRHQHPLSFAGLHHYRQQREKALNKQTETQRTGTCVVSQ